MTRLQHELARLYGAAPTSRDGAVRTLVLELARPADWTLLGAAWRGVQAELELPAPAIAVSGAEGLQLWFSLAAPVSPQDGAAFLQGLCGRFLADVAPKRLRLIADAADLPALPPRECTPDHWSAFVTPDLASVFAETPWLDIAPTDEGQASVLRPLASIGAAAFEAALAQCRAVATPAATAAPAASSTTTTSTGDRVHAPTDAAAFLRRVMNDEAAPLALRVEAAKALLPYDISPHRA